MHLSLHRSQCGDITFIESTRRKKNYGRVTVGARLSRAPNGSYPGHESELLKSLRDGMDKVHKG